MFTTKNFKCSVNKKSCSEAILKGILRIASSKSTLLYMSVFIGLFILSGCESCKSMGQDIVSWHDEKLAEQKEKRLNKEEGKPSAHIMVR